MCVCVCVFSGVREPADVSCVVVVVVRVVSH